MAPPVTGFFRKGFVDPTIWRDRVLPRLGLSPDFDMKELGDGGFGTAYDIGGGKALKVTLDDQEANAAFILMKRPFKEAYHVEDVFKIPGKDPAFGIVMERLYPADKAYFDFPSELRVFFSVFDDDGLQWARMSFLEKAELFYKSDFRNNYPSRLEEEALWFLRLAKGLAERGIEEKDFHSRNILKRKDGSHCVIDIGGMSTAPQGNITEASMKNLLVAKRLTELAWDLATAGWRDEGSYFEGVDEIVSDVKNSSPDSSNVASPEPPEDRLPYIKRLHGRKVRWWADGSHVVKIDADKVIFMEGNDWNFSHAAAIMQLMENGEYIEVPAGRVFQIDAEELARSEKYDEAGELDEQMGMTRAWEEKDVGSYYAQLVDGNHRASAAMALGEKYIYVYVAENYRKNIKEGDLF